MPIDPRTPVLVGAAQFTDRDSAPQDALSPLGLLAKVGAGAITDCRGKDVAVDSLVVTRLFSDSSGAFKGPFGRYTNLPKSLASRLGQSPRTLIYGPVGGNTPQMFVNHFADLIARGEADTVLLAGSEALRTQAKAQKAGLALDWSEDTGDEAQSFGKETHYVSRHELTHGIAMPVHIYPMFENALGAHYGRSPVEQRQAIGRLMARFAEVAASNPYSALPIARSAEALITPTDDNRYIAYPYTKYLNSNMFVDQAAAVLLMSTAAADKHGVPQSKRIYLHGCADTNEKILLSDREGYAHSTAIKVGAAHALAEAGITTGDLQHIELYSCFPVAVEIAADMIGLRHDDARGLTLTGGLPYFGGPGNNYSMHGIAEMIARCRAMPGSRGLVFANGGYLTKHSFGVYSSLPPAAGWSRADPAAYQAQIDAQPSPILVEKPSGTGTVETFTVVYDRGRPAFAIVIGRLESGERYLSQMHDNLDALIDKPVIGRRIRVTAGDTINMSVLA